MLLDILGMKTRKERSVKEADAKISVLFVCMGNICRSPTAEGVFRKLVSDAGLTRDIHIDSAGTHAYHEGEPPDRRACEAAELRGISMDGQSARRVNEADFEYYDLIIAMDRLNLETLRDRADVIHHEKLRLMLDFKADTPDADVPDPYYGGAAGFERVLDLVEEASIGLLDHVKRRIT